MFSSHDELRLHKFLERKTTEVVCPAHHDTSGHTRQRDSSLLAEAYLSRAFTVQPPTPQDFSAGRQPPAKAGVTGHLFEGGVNTEVTCGNSSAADTCSRDILLIRLPSCIFYFLVLRFSLYILEDTEHFNNCFNFPASQFHHTWVCYCNFFVRSDILLPSGPSISFNWIPDKRNVTTLCLSSVVLLSRMPSVLKEGISLILSGLSLSSFTSCQGNSSCTLKPRLF